MEENERTLYENLEYLNETKGIIKQAIIDKGVEVSADTPFREYADKIGDIQGGSGDLDDVITAQEQYIAELETIIDEKASGGDNSYTELEYIESTGTQYIRPVEILSINKKIVADVYIDSNTSLDRENTFIGCGNWYQGVECYFDTSNCIKMWVKYHGDIISLGPTTPIYDQVIHCEAETTTDGSILTINYAETFSSSITLQDTSFPNNLFPIFAYSGFSEIRYPFIGRIYSLKLYQDNVLKYDFIPVRKNINNEVCLYDRLNERFYGNDGTGSFIAGPTKGGKNPNYVELEYIQSTGVQYIDTNIIPTNTTGIYGTVISQDISSDVVYFGSTGGTDARFWVGNNGSRIYYGWNTVKTRSATISTTDIHRISMNYKNNRKELYNGSTVKDIGTESLNTNNNSIYIFGGNKGESDASYKSSIKLYRLGITRDDVTVCDLIPVKRKSDNEICLYDLVTETFFTNLGTGSFIAGPEKN